MVAAYVVASVIYLGYVLVLWGRTKRVTTRED
jgi:hypothetical protein